MLEIFPSIKGFTSSVLDSEKTSKELLTPPMTLPKSHFFFIEIKLLKLS